MGLEHFDEHGTAAAIFEALDRDGAVVLGLPGGAELVDAARAELAPWLSLPTGESPMGNNPFTGMKTLRTSALIRKSRACGALALSPPVLEVVDRVLGPQCARFQLSFTQAIAIAPGERAQFVHRDTTMYPLRRPGPEVFVNVIWAASPFTEANGATVIFPGSHRWPEGRLPTVEDERVSATMPRGGCVIYYGSVIHGGGRNATADEMRLGIAFGYTLGWLRQEENQYLAVPPDVAKDLSPELQRLIGYAEHYPFLGWNEGQDQALFRGGASRERYETAIVGGRSKSIVEIMSEGKIREKA
jgi:ectoine hydroxylase-related dioxygenase (phytanoyl-CoA dioxygenase family)